MPLGLFYYLFSDMAKNLRLFRANNDVTTYVGGFTADYLMLKKGNADLTVCDSLEHGVILLYNAIKSKVNADFDMLIDESDIDSIIKGEQHGFPREVVTLTEKMAAAFVDQLFGKLRERLIDLRVGKTIFIGGGSILLRKSNVPAPYHQDVHAEQ